MMLGTDQADPHQWNFQNKQQINKDKKAHANILNFALMVDELAKAYITFVISQNLRSLFYSELMAKEEIDDRTGIAHQRIPHLPLQLAVNGNNIKRA